MKQLLVLLLLLKIFSSPVWAVKTGPSRPNPCQPFDQNFPLSTFCADQLQVKDSVTYFQNEGPQINKKWGGQIEIDLSQTKIPLVGKTDLSLGSQELEDQLRLQEYLADYFEGTTFYNQEPVDIKNKEDLKRVFQAGGIFSKLATKELQDKLKENMVLRALGQKPRWPGEKSPVHDYLVVKVKNGQVVPTEEADAQEVHLSDFANHLRPIKDDYQTWEEYYRDLKVWQNSQIKGVKTEILWAYIPMFSREDVTGYLSLNLKKENAEDLLDLTDSQDSQKIKVPHLARLNEVTSQIAQLLNPFQKNGSSLQSSINSSSKLAQNQNQILGVSTADLLACDWEKLALQNPGDKVCGQTIKANLAATEVFENRHFQEPLPTLSPTRCIPPECFDDEDCLAFGEDYECRQNCCQKKSLGEQRTHNVSRKINLFVKIPLLDKIWQNTVSGEKSIFSLFLKENPDFDPSEYDYPGMNKVEYRYQGSTENVIAGTDKNGGQAKIYYQHLGGLRCLRDKILQTLLPTDSGFTPLCPSEKIKWPPAPPLTQCPGDETYRGRITGVCCDYGVTEGPHIKPDNPYYMNISDECYSSCHIEVFPQDKPPFGKYPDFCYYCNKVVCVRNDGLGGCAGVCNWQCCQGKNKK